MAKIWPNFPKFDENIQLQIQEAQETYTRIKAKKKKQQNKSKNIIILQAEGKNNIIYRGITIQLTTDLSSEAMKARRNGNYMFEKLKNKPNLILIPNLDTSYLIPVVNSQNILKN